MSRKTENQFLQKIFELFEVLGFQNEDKNLQKLVLLT